MRKRSCTASTWPSVRRDPPWPSWWRGWQTPMLWSTPSWCLPPRLTPLPCSTWLHTPAAPWASTSETMANTPSSSTTIFPNRWELGTTAAVYCLVNLFIFFAGQIQEPIELRTSCEGERFIRLAQIGWGFATLTNRKRLGLYKVTSMWAVLYSSLRYWLFNGHFLPTKLLVTSSLIHWSKYQSQSCAWYLFHIL